MAYTTASSLGACCSSCAHEGPRASLGVVTSGQMTAAKLVGTGLGVATFYGVGRLVGGPKGGLVGAGLSLAYSLFQWTRTK